MRISRPAAAPLSQTSVPSPENPTARLVPTFLWSSLPGVRSANGPPPTCFSHTWKGPSRSAMKATNRPSGEMAASSSLPSKLVKGVNVALASRLSMDEGGDVPRVSQLATAVARLSTTTVRPSAVRQRRGRGGSRTAPTGSTSSTASISILTSPISLARCV